jgi:hypothetical protein
MTKPVAIRNDANTASSVSSKFSGCPKDDTIHAGPDSTIVDIPRRTDSEHGNVEDIGVCSVGGAKYGDRDDSGVP